MYRYDMGRMRIEASIWDYIPFRIGLFAGLGGLILLILIIILICKCCGCCTYEKSRPPPYSEHDETTAQYMETLSMKSSDTLFASARRYSTNHDNMTGVARNSIAGSLPRSIHSRQAASLHSHGTNPLGRNSVSRSDKSISHREYSRIRSSQNEYSFGRNSIVPDNERDGTMELPDELPV